ncbi:hypothetical protein ACEPAG_2059 [Sanghuangporus baumii]
MPPPISTHHDDERALGAHDYDHEINVDHVDLTRFGPDLAGVKIPLVVHSSSAFSPSNDSKSTRSTGRFGLPQHNATDSFAESVASTDSNAEAIELSSLHSFRRTDRAQPFVGLPSSHGRFESIASSSTTASLPLSSSTSASDDEYIYGDEIGARSEVRLSLEQAGIHPQPARPDSPNARTGTEENPDGRPPHESFPPLPPMSPRQTRFPHRIYVPESTHHSNVQTLPNDFSEVDIHSPSSSSPARHSPDSEHSIAIETDSLLPIQKPTSADGLPLPATSPSCDEPNPFRFSYSHSETVFYVFGFSITTLLVVLSVWLTLTDIVM